MKAITIIPARLNSSRLEKKLLQKLGDKTILQHTFENASMAKLSTQTIIATDSEEIAAVAERFGAETVMTREGHTSGSARVAEAAAHYEADIIVNIQGDEPELSPDYIDALIETKHQTTSFAATLACPFPPDVDRADPSFVKVVFGGEIDQETHWAAYFSRAPIPFGDNAISYLHLGAYAYSRESIMAFANARPSGIEQMENLEQLRIISLGEKIAVRLVERSAPGIDTQADLDAARRRFNHGHQ